MTDFDKSKVKVGDFITVSRRFKVTNVNEFGFSGLLVKPGGQTETGLSRGFRWDEEEGLTHEPAPVEVFKAGDVVRVKNSDHYYTLGTDAYGRKVYTSHRSGATTVCHGDIFTSRLYERVEL